MDTSAIETRLNSLKIQTSKVIEVVQSLRLQIDDLESLLVLSKSLVCSDIEEYDSDELEVSPPPAPEPVKAKPLIIRARRSTPLSKRSPEGPKPRAPNQYVMISTRTPSDASAEESSDSD